METQQEYVLVLRPLPSGWRVSGEMRLRAALKTLLRGYGLRCVRVEPKAVAELSAGQPRPKSNRNESSTFEAVVVE